MCGAGPLASSASGRRADDFCRGGGCDLTSRGRLWQLLGNDARPPPGRAETDTLDWRGGCAAAMSHGAGAGVCSVVWAIIALLPDECVSCSGQVAAVDLAAGFVLHALEDTENNRSCMVFSCWSQPRHRRFACVFGCSASVSNFQVMLCYWQRVRCGFFHLPLFGMPQFGAESSLYPFHPGHPPTYPFLSVYPGAQDSYRHCLWSAEFRPMPHSCTAPFQYPYHPGHQPIDPSPPVSAVPRDYRHCIWSAVFR